MYNERPKFFLIQQSITWYGQLRHAVHKGVDDRPETNSPLLYIPEHPNPSSLLSTGDINWRLKIAYWLLLMLRY